MLIELAVFSIEAAILAQKSGAERIELCSSPFEGGLTPSHGTILLAARELTIPLHVMIRPREGDFCYSECEFRSMLYDIDFCKQAGVQGIVTGLLLPDGKIDIERLRIIMERARPLSVTFHRAFDLSINPTEALEELVECGVDRILTSGGMNTAMQGAEQIAEWITQAADRITILPGSGIHDGNFKELIEKTGASEIHLTAKMIVPGIMTYRKQDIPMGTSLRPGNYEMIMPDPGIIRKIREHLK